MPIAPTYPGVYIEEIPSGVHTITVVATSITGFVGRTLRGPLNAATRIQSFAEFERVFGGLALLSPLSYAVQQFFLNGGSDALVVRVIHTGDGDATKNAKSATLTLPAGANTLPLQAANSGDWGNKLRARVDYNTRPLQAGEGNDTLFNLTVKDMGTGAQETHRNVSIESNNKRFVQRVLQNESALVLVGAGGVPTTRPDKHTDVAAGVDPFAEGQPTSNYTVSNKDGQDGGNTTADEVTGKRADKSGMYALEDADLFNLLCLPPLARDTEFPTNKWGEPLAYCRERRAMLIVDPPDAWNKTADVEGGSGVDSLNLRDKNAVIYFPRVKLPDPLMDNGLQEFVPCGVMAGLYARTDAQRGVWKVPAGIEATLTGVQELSYKLTDGENGRLNPLGVNCLRNFPVFGNVAWGGRTLEGADALTSEWKYIPVRRTALYIEESLYRGTKWVVFEPNDEPLWAQIRLNVGAFMQDLFRQGAFQGKTPREAYFVKCDKETNPQNDIDRGIVNIIVGFAPLKPAEFVIIQLQQIAGQIQT